MTILQLISSRQVYGAEKVILPLCKALQQKGLKVILGIMDHFEEENELESAALKEGLEVKRIVTHRQIDPKALDHLRRLIKACSPHIIHSHNYKSNFYASLTKTPRQRWILTAHGWCGTNLKTKCYDTLDRILIRFADAVVAVSLNILEELAQWRVPKPKCFYIPNALECPVEAPHALDETFTVGFVGRLEKEKNIKVVTQALIQFLAHHKDSQALILGDGSLRPWVQNLIQEHGLQKRILLLGKVPAQEMKNYYQKIDCLFHPSLRDGLPMVVLEALCFGIPIVGSARALKDVGEKPFTRIIQEPRQTKQAVSQAVKFLTELREMYQNKEAFLRLSQLAQKEAQKFNTSSMVNKYFDLYQKLL